MWSWYSAMEVFLLKDIVFQQKLKEDESGRWPEGAEDIQSKILWNSSCFKMPGFMWKCNSVSEAQQWVQFLQGANNKVLPGKAWIWRVWSHYTLSKSSGQWGTTCFLNIFWGEKAVEGPKKQWDGIVFCQDWLSSADILSSK